MFIFNSRYNTLTVVLRPVRRIVVGTQVVKEDGLSAHFDRGIFTTEDEETAQLLRDKIKKTRDPNVVEITSVDQRAFSLLKKGSKNIRHAVTAAEISKTNPAQAKLSEQEPGTALNCVICESMGVKKAFKNQKALNLHLISHRADVQVSKPLEAAKAAEAKVEEKPANPEEA